MKKRNLFALLGTAAVFTACTTLPSQARNETFEWDANPEPDVNEYRIEVRDVTTNAVLKSVTVSDNPATPANDTPTTVTITGYPLKATKVVAFAVARVDVGPPLESLESDPLSVEAFKPGQVLGLRKLGAIGIQSAGPAEVVKPAARKIK